MTGESSNSGLEPWSSALPDPLTPPSDTIDDLTERLRSLHGVPSASISPPAEFWESCAWCVQIVDALNEPLLYRCEGCRCRIWRSSITDEEVIAVWHGSPRKVWPAHQLVHRVHTPESCMQWVQDDRNPDTEKARRDREKRSGIPE